MAAYVLSDPRIIDALTDAAERGVLIRLYLDRSQFAEHGPTRGGLVEALLAHPNVVARVKGEGVLMHLKAYAIDGAVLRTGSGNFSRSGLASQDNDAIFITDPTVVDVFESNFERIWMRAQNVRALDANTLICRARPQPGPSAERFRNQRRRSRRPGSQTRREMRIVDAWLRDCDPARTLLAQVATRLRQPQWRIALVTLIECLGAEHADSFHAMKGCIALCG